MGNLRQRMNASIGSSSGCNIMSSRLKLGEGRLNGALHRRLLGLALPSDKRRSVIFNF